MSAATARRTNYGTSSTTTTLPSHHHHHHQQPFPTPVSAASSSATTTAGTSTGRAPVTGAVMGRSAPAPASLAYPPPRTAGDSWSLQRDGERTVIVIEDTPPPTAGAASNASMASRALPPPNAYPSSSSLNANPAKRAKPNGVNHQPSSASGVQSNGYAGYAVNNYSYPQPSNYGASTSANAVASSRKASGAKRKYNEVVDPASAADRQYAAQRAQAALPCDDKDGHYIIRADDELGDTRRYKIIRLLGQGTFGKVVEAWDRDAGTRVAVKIIRAIQKYRDASKVEIKVLNTLRERDPMNRYKCIHLVDCFDHRNHICIVTSLLSCSVFDFLKDNNYLPFPMSHIQHFAKQLLTSVAFLHDLRLVHTDLKPENILLVDSDHGNINIKPSKAAPQVKTKRILKDSNIHLIDFGSATFEEEYHASVVSTRHYRAPEIILGLGWSYPCDVWSIGCILVEFFTGEALFQTHENLEHLAMMEIVFGKVPSDSRWGKQAARSKPEWFQNGYKVNYPTQLTTRQSKKYVKAMKPLDAIIPPTNIVQSRFLDLLNHLLKWDPAERYTVREALRHPFFSLNIDDEETRGISR